MPENKLENSSRRGSSFKKKVGLAVTSAGAVAAGLFGADQEAKPVSAAALTPTVKATDTIIPTPTARPTFTKTPEPQDREIAALQTAIAMEAARREKDKKIADLKATATAFAVTPTAPSTLTPTPTKTSTPEPTNTAIPSVTSDTIATSSAASANIINARATNEAVRSQALGKEQAKIITTATADALATAGAKKPSPTTEPASGGKGSDGGNNQGSGIPWQVPAGVAGAGIAGRELYRRNDGVKNFINNAWAVTKAVAGTIFHR